MQEEFKTELNKLTVTSNSSNTADQLAYFKRFPIFIKKIQESGDIQFCSDMASVLNELINEWHRISGLMHQAASTSGMNYETIIDYVTLVTDFSAQLEKICKDNAESMQQKQALDISLTEEQIVATTMDLSEKEAYENAISRSVILQSKDITVKKQQSEQSPFGPAVYYTYSRFGGLLSTLWQSEQMVQSNSNPKPQNALPHMPSYEEPRKKQ